MAGERRRAGKFETFGAWLRIWTPARDVEVPPVPWRRLLLIGLPSLAAAAALTWLVVDGASESRHEREAREEEAAAERAERRRERLTAEQALHIEHVASSSRPALVRKLEAAVLADARTRFRQGNLERAVKRVDCEPFPRTAPRRAAELDPARSSGRYYCVAVTSDIVGTGEGSIGYPFFARIRYERATLAWCKINPIPGEQAVPDPRSVTTLPQGCT